MHINADLVSTSINIGAFAFAVGTISMTGGSVSAPTVVLPMHGATHRLRVRALQLGLLPVLATARRECCGREWRESGVGRPAAMLPCPRDTRFEAPGPTGGMLKGGAMGAASSEGGGEGIGSGGVRAGESRESRRRGCGEKGGRGMLWVGVWFLLKIFVYAVGELGCGLGSLCKRVRAGSCM